tara:strand:+ start:31 stop:132 length:102 start_codon:yes stop_codon:yes gene_type:complete
MMGRLIKDAKSGDLPSSLIVFKFGEKFENIFIV